MDFGLQVRSLALYESEIHSENQVSIPLSQLDSLVSSTSNQYDSYKAVPRSKRKLYRDKAVENAVKTFFSKLRSLQALVILHPEVWELPLVERVGGKEISCSFLTNSLEHVCIGRARNREENLPANKAVWLLCFCPLLRQTSLTIKITTKSGSFLEEHHETFSGLSKIEDLALEVHFIHDQSDTSTWWGLPWESWRRWRLGTR